MKSKNKLQKKFFFLLIVTNLCSITFGAFGFKGKGTPKKAILAGSHETIIQIPVKLFTRTPKENERYKEVTVKNKQGKIIFNKAKLLSIHQKKKLRASLC